MRIRKEMKTGVLTVAACCLCHVSGAESTKLTGAFKQMGRTWAKTEMPAAGHVYGGAVIDGTDYPFLAVLIDDQVDHFIQVCDGSLVSDTFVLTAAHCEAFNQVCIGGSDLSKLYEFECYGVAEYMTHPKWDARTIGYDAALVRLDGRTSITPATLNGITKRDNPKQPVRVMGFGVNQEGNVDGALRIVKETIITQEECSVWKSPLPDPMPYSAVCTLADADGESACQGDSGGPLVDQEDNSLLLGIVSFGANTCGVQHPNVYTRVRHIEDWVREITLTTPATTDWSEWSGCDAVECPGTGVHTRSRQCLTDNTQICPVVSENMTCHHDCGDVVVPELQESNSGDGDTDGDTNSSDDNAETASTYSDSIVWTKCTSTCGTGLRWQICDDCERRLIETCNTHACDDTGAPELEGQDRAGSKDTNRVWKTNTHTDTAAYEDGAEQHIVSTRRTDSASSQVAPLWAYTGLYTIAISIWVNGY